jgi:hypothetical protein
MVVAGAVGGVGRVAMAAVEEEKAITSGEQGTISGPDSVSESDSSSSDLDTVVVGGGSRVEEAVEVAGKTGVEAGAPDPEVEVAEETGVPPPVFSAAFTSVSDALAGAPNSVVEDTEVKAHRWRRGTVGTIL